MNNHLQAAVKRDNRKSYPISPISDVDAEIIQEIIICLGKLEEYDIKSILEHWKFLLDENIRDLLLEWNFNHAEDFNEDDGNKFKRKFVDFEGSIVEVSFIKSIHVDDSYNYSTNEMEYRIIINKDLPEKFLLTDLIFSYSTLEVRENKLNNLKKYLSKYIEIVR